ncbi:tetratricopeptide repeat protein [Variovorax sp. PvP013_2]
MGEDMPIPTRAIVILLNFFLYATLNACKPDMQAYAYPFTAQSDLAQLSEEGVLPRNINLKTFDPHRDAGEFACRNQATSAPTLTPQAQELHEHAMTLTSGELWPNERDWPQAMKLWDQAAAQGHWKAALMWLQTARTGAGVNSVKGRFQVSPEMSEVVVSKMEVLMRQGVADAFFWMGEFYGGGYGVKQSTDRQWAFYELAADLGSPLAQTMIAGVLELGHRDMEKPGQAKWANHALMFKLLECAYAQGYGKAGFQLGTWLRIKAKGVPQLIPPSTTPEEQFARALQILHDGVKFGSEDAAGYLSSSLRSGDPINRHQIDKVRADRYRALAEALWHNPDLRFPNLDRVLPLPPAKLPQWDGNPDTLIDAAKAVRVTPRAQKLSGHVHPPAHRAHIPPGQTLQVPPHLAHMLGLPGFTSILADVPGATGLARASVTGYWQPRVSPARATDSIATARLRRDLANRPPLRFREGERMQLDVGNTDLPHEDLAHYLVTWHFMGWPVAQRVPQDWLVEAGTARAIDEATQMTCKGDQACPQTGIWQPHVVDEAQSLSRTSGTSSLESEGWKWQAFVEKGQRMPSLRAKGVPMKDEQVDWRLMLACESGFDGPMAG